MDQRIILDDNDLKYCEKELNETSDNLQLILNLQNHVKELNIKTDNYTLLRFLRATKFDLKKSTDKINNYYKLRNESIWFKNRNPELDEIDSILKLGMFLPLLTRDKEGRCIIIVRAAKHDPKLYTIDEVSKAGLMVMDLLYDRFEYTSVYGVRLVFDLEGISLGHARQFGISTVKQIVHIWQDCYPVKIKSFYCINVATFMNIILNLFKSFMSSKMKERVHIGGNNQTIKEKIPEEILPKEYGGQNSTIDELTNYWRDAVIDNKTWFN